MRAINLLPGDEQRPRLEGLRTPLLVLAGGMAAATAAAVVLALGASGTADDRRVQVAAAKAELQSLPKAPQPAVSQGMLAQERSNRTAALAAALRTRTSFDRVLRQIALVLPEDAWLTGLSVVSPLATTPVATSPATAPRATSASPASGLTIDGATYTHAGVVHVLSRLAIVPSLADVRLTTSSIAEQQAPTSSSGGQQTEATRTPGKKFVTFTISASLATGGAK